jgi:hypothetical protein
VGDTAHAVARNLEIIRQETGADRVVTVNQVHGSRVVVIDQVDAGQEGSQEADALVTALPGIALVVKQADCQAVMIFDPVRRAVANVHCGWRGSVSNILARTVQEMTFRFGSLPADMTAAIGPSLGPCCAEFVTHEEIFPRDFRRFMTRENHFDLWALSVHQLIEAGLREENIELARLCTRCRTDLFFSHRGEGKTGRFASVIMLKGMQ